MVAVEGSLPDLPVSITEVAETVASMSGSVLRGALFPTAYRGDAVHEAPGSFRSFSGRDAKELARRAEELLSLGARTAVSQFVSSHPETTKKGFWEPLLHLERVTSHSNMLQLYRAVVELLSAVSIPSDSSFERSYESMQAASGALALHFCPEVLRCFSPRALVEVTELASDKPVRSLGQSSRLVTFLAGSRRLFSTIRCPPTAGNEKELEMGLTVPVALPQMFRSPNPYYATESLMAFHIASSQVIVESGAAVYVQLVYPRICLASAMSGMTHFEDFSQTEAADYLLLHIFGRQWPPGIDVHWFLQKASTGDTFVVLRRMLGLVHPDRPFGMSASVLLLEQESDIAQVIEISDCMGVNLRIQQTTTIPFSFPPSLTDLDQRLQRAHSYLTLGALGAATAVTEATSAVAAELLGDNLGQLAQIDETEFSATLRNVDQLVREALEALREAQLARRQSEAIAAHILNLLVNQAWYDIRIKHEWRQVNARVESWAKERQRASKNKKQKGKKLSARPLPMVNALVQVVEELQTRTLRYRRTAAGIVGMVQAGLAQVVVPPVEEAAHGELTGSKLFEKPEILLEILPKRRPTNKIGEVSCALVDADERNHRRRHFMEELDAVSARDRDLALAHREERGLKLALQLSLEDVG